MLGVGKKTKPRLEAIGITTIGDAAKLENQDRLVKVVGKAMAAYLYERANGIDNSEVDYLSFDEVSSVSNSHTFDYDIYNVKLIKETLKVLTNTVSDRLMNRNLVAQTIGIQIKYANFKMINRSKSVDHSMNDSLEMWAVVEDLL